MTFKNLLDGYLEFSVYVWAGSFLCLALMFFKMAIQGFTEAHVYANLYNEFWIEVVIFALFVPSIFIWLFRIAKERRDYVNQRHYQVQ